MLSVEEALDKILHHIEPLGTEKVSLLEALGRVIAEDIYAPRDIPPLDNSGMDGYAVRWKDIEKVLRLATLRVIPRRTISGAASADPDQTFFLPAISSTEIRERIRDGETVEAFLPRAVRRYIVQRGLYR